MFMAILNPNSDLRFGMRVANFSRKLTTAFHAIGNLAEKKELLFQQKCDAFSAFHDEIEILSIDLGIHTNRNEHHALHCDCEAHNLAVSDRMVSAETGYSVCRKYDLQIQEIDRLVEEIYREIDHEYGLLVAVRKDVLRLLESNHGENHLMMFDEIMQVGEIFADKHVSLDA